MKATPTIASVKIKMMESSVTCLTLGLLGLLPIIGLPFAFAALWASYSAKKNERYFWNPAKPHRVVGMICAIIGALVWSVVNTVLIYHIADIITKGL